ncbi:MAG: molecular chaperone [Pseudomonas sp.]
MKRLLPALALSLCAAAQAGPTINVGTVYDYLDGDKSTFLKRVFNPGDTTAFVRVQVYEISFDANGKSIETALDSQSGDAALRTGLIASPARLIVPPKGMQATRLLYRGDRDSEHYYRVRFVPVMPEKEDNFDVSETERQAYKQSMSAGVNVLAGYGTVFFVSPKNMRFDTRLQDVSGHYRVSNAGNSTVEVNQFKDCSAAKKDDCLPVSKHHIRPGRNFEFNKEPGRIYSFELKEGNKNKAIEVGK